MTFIPLARLFDPRAPRGHTKPIAWLQAHSPRWAFPPNADPRQVDGYVAWLHVRRVDGALSQRERLLRPPLAFRVRIALRRARILYWALEGAVPEDIMADLKARDAEVERERNHD